MSWACIKRESSLQNLLHSIPRRISLTSTYRLPQPQMLRSYKVALRSMNFERDQASCNQLSHSEPTMFRYAIPQRGSRWLWHRGRVLKTWNLTSRLVPHLARRIAWSDKKKTISDEYVAAKDFFYMCSNHWYDVIEWFLSIHIVFIIFLQDFYHRSVHYIQYFSYWSIK